MTSKEALQIIKDKKVDVPYIIENPEDNIKIVDFHHCVADIKGYYEDIEGDLDDGN